MTENNLTVRKLKEKFANAILETTTFRGEVTVTVSKGEIFEISRFLHSDEDLQYSLLTDLCMKSNQRLRVKTRVGETESIPSVESIWKVADWYEREAYDLFGIRFENHPDLRRILLWEGFEGHPLRKDYPAEGPDFDKPFVPEV
jgi:NADH-quinone oxidoreductase subunit C